MKNNGFTLIELSIVLVIIGLIVGGILMGRDLINAANTRAAVSQLEKFQTVFNTFKLKYNCEAGDCPNATAFFGDFVDGGNCSAMTNGSSNGNGNGMLDNGGSAHWYCEGFCAVQSLALSKLLPSNSTTEEIEGINGSVALFYHDDLQNQVTARNKSTIAWVSYVSGITIGGAFSPMEGRNIDSKIDDGVPNTGRFIGLDVAVSDPSIIVPNTCSTAGAYNVTETQTCRSIFYYQ